MHARLFGTLLWLVALGSNGYAMTPFAEPEETHAELLAVCRRLTAGENHYFGQAIVSDLESRLRGTATGGLAGARLRGRLGRELIRLGEPERAVEILEEAYRLLEPGDDGPADPPAADPSLWEALLYNLAAAHFQLAEEQNCVALHTATSCLLPFAPDAIHQRPEHARRAADLYLRLLQSTPEDPQARWLFNLASLVAGEVLEDLPAPYRLPPGALEPEAEFPRWLEIAAILGVNAYDLAGGAAMDDFDGDGLLDLVSSTWDPCAPMKAFRNRGDGSFEDVTESWGLDSQLGGLNLVQTDFDNDGMLDLLVLRGAWLGEDGRQRNSLLRNDLERPAGRFVDVTAAAGLAHPAYPTQAGAWADFDGDGDLDLFVGNEAAQTALMTWGETADPYPSQLFRNNGDGTFTDIARAAGVTNRRFTKSAAWGDYDNDGDPDLYLSNFGENRLYRNNNDGTFTDVASDLEVTEPAQGSFVAWFFDYDNDGDLDIFVADYDAPVPAVSASYLGLPTSGDHPVVYRNDKSRFVDVSTKLGLDRPLLPMGANYGDLDNDGWLDIYLGTGVPNYEALMPNVMYRNDGGRRFLDVTFAGGFGHLQKGHGIAFGDLDNDGDQDLFEQMGGAFPYDAFFNALFENPGGEDSWLVLRLVGRRANRFGIGGRIEVQVDEGNTRRSIFALVGTGGSFGGSSLQQEIGLGQAQRIERLIITWPGSGTRQEFLDIAPNHHYEVIEGVPELRLLEPPRFRLGARSAEPTARHQHPGGTAQ